MPHTTSSDLAAAWTAAMSQARADLRARIGAVAHAARDGESRPGGPGGERVGDRLMHPFLSLSLNSFNSLNEFKSFNYFNLRKLNELKRLSEQQRITVAANDPHAERDDEHGVAVDGEVGLALGGDAGDPDSFEQGAQRVLRCGQEPERDGTAGDADEARLALGQGERGDHAAQLAAVERAVGSYGLRWNAGPARHLGVAAGLPPGLARACVAAYGDSVLPQITEAIGNAIRRTDQAMRAAA